MENSASSLFKSLLDDPSQVSQIMQDPSKKGLEFYNNLPVKEQQYLIFAAAAGLIAYGIYLGRKNA